MNIFLMTQKFMPTGFIEKIIDRAGQLKSFARSGRVVPEFNTKWIRELIEGNYRIIYTINPDNGVSIIRIHHSARQLKL